jgi:hypothetical protein
MKPPFSTNSCSNPSVIFEKAAIPVAPYKYNDEPQGRRAWRNGTGARACAGYLLVPKLYLGTHLSVKLCFAAAATKLCGQGRSQLQLGNEGLGNASVRAISLPASTAPTVARRSTATPECP